MFIPHNILLVYDMTHTHCTCMVSFLNILPFSYMFRSQHSKKTVQQTSERKKMKFKKIQKFIAPKNMSVFHMRSKQIEKEKGKKKHTKICE